ncbi:hypothetical protein [Microcoleus sp. BROC3]|uniref:hypothetical protein n=1 Tax=Microcoleus sp. BROC3 TaxID=3055323 RepID=UPI002FD64738
MSSSVLFERTFAISPVEFIPCRTRGLADSRLKSPAPEETAMPFPYILQTMLDIQVSLC